MEIKNISKLVDKKMVYVGDNPMLVGETALVKIDGEAAYAQFDNLKGLPACLTHGWTPFHCCDFDPMPVEKNANGHEVECNCIVCLPDPHSRFQ